MALAKLYEQCHVTTKITGHVVMVSCWSGGVFIDFALVGEAMGLGSLLQLLEVHVHKSSKRNDFDIIRYCKLPLPIQSDSFFLHIQLIRVTKQLPEFLNILPLQKSLTSLPVLHF